MSSEADTVPVQTAQQRPSRGRSIAAGLCIVLAGLLTTPAAVAYWGQRTINDTERYLETVGPLVDSPEVQDAIATKVTDAITAQVDIEKLIKQVFAGVITERPRLEILVGPLAGAVNSLIENQVRAFIASDTFAEFWVTANTRAQIALVGVLKGDDSGAVTLEDDEVVLNVSEVIAEVKTRLIDRGLTVLENVQIPDTDRQIVLLDAPALKQARTIYAFTNPVAQWAIVAVAGLFVLALLLSRRRPRMTVAIGAVLVANSLLVALLLNIGRQLFVNELAGTVFGPASTVLFHTLLAFIERGQQVFLWLGLFLMVVGWFAGITRSATAVRGALAGGLERLGGLITDGPATATGRWVAGNAGWLRGAVGVLGVVVLLWGNDLSENRLVWSLVLVLVLLAVVQVLVGVGRASTPPPPTTPIDPEAGGGDTGDDAGDAGDKPDLVDSGAPRR